MKTYKRELAIAVMVWFMYVVEVKDANIVELLVWPVFTFAALAFGLDWFGKDGSKSLSAMSERKDTDRVREPLENER